MAGVNGAEERIDDSLMNLDFSRVCRLCLNLSPDFVDLRASNGNRNGARNIIDQIKYCYNIKIDLTESLPSKICFQCIQLLTLFTATKRNIKYSEMMLRNIVNIRDANQIINSSRRGINPSVLQRYLHLSDDNHREEGSSVAQERPTQDNFHFQTYRINPIQITSVQEFYRQQNQAVEENDENAPMNPNRTQNKDKVTEKRNVKKRNSSTESARVVENKPIEKQQNHSSNKKTVKSSPSQTVLASASQPCGTSTNSKPHEESACITIKTCEEDKMKNTDKKPDLVNNINNKKPPLIDCKRDLRVKLEILDLKNTKKYLSPSTDTPRVSIEGQGGKTSSEKTSGKAVKGIGAVIDESNILSPKVKRMRKSKG